MLPSGAFGSLILVMLAYWLMGQYTPTKPRAKQAWFILKYCVVLPISLICGFVLGVLLYWS